MFHAPEEHTPIRGMQTIPEETRSFHGLVENTLGRKFDLKLKKLIHFRQEKKLTL